MSKWLRVRTTDGDHSDVRIDAIVAVVYEDEQIRLIFGTGAEVNVIPLENDPILDALGIERDETTEGGQTFFGQ